MKMDLAIQLTNKADVINGMRGFQKIAEYYEDVNLAHYVDMQANRLMLNNPDNTALKDQMTSASANVRNTFVDIYHWVQGELYDLQAIADACAMRLDLDKKLFETNRKKQSTMKDITDLEAGNKSVGTLFKNKDDIGNL
jgi:hypothetical protein